MLKDYLNELTASYGLLYIKLHQFHWYVKGSSFFTLHEKFEELYDGTTEDLDLVAERLLQIGGNPVSTLGEFIQYSWIKEAPYTAEIAPIDMVKTIKADYELLNYKLTDGLDIAKEEDDEVTIDMIIGFKTGIEKTLWMLNAYLA